MTLDVATDKVIGYVDLGPLSRYNQYANHNLCFMMSGLRKSSKQIVAHFHNQYANHAICFMINGVRKSWKQPVSPKSLLKLTN